MILVLKYSILFLLKIQLILGDKIRIELLISQFFI
jgi:hypothetical protein